MPMFRNSSLLLDQRDPSAVDLEGRTYRVKPVDGDAVPDHEQHWRVLLDLRRTGDGGARATVYTSFDAAVWHPVAQVDANGEQLVRVDFVELPAFAPYLKVRTTLVQPQEQGQTPPQHTINARLASDGPFTIVPV